MKRIEVAHGWGVTSLTVVDQAMADESYEKLKKALSTHERFHNDSSKVVEVSHSFGAATFVIEHITSVVMMDLGTTANDDAIVEYETRSHLLRRRVDAAVAAAQTSGE
jgi:hypothetical protein